jgi:lysophospholipase L1-like esterase
MVSTQNLEQKWYSVHTDSNGFIVGESEEVNATGPIDILFFGGSTTECIFVEEEFRFPHLVGKLLEDSHTGRTIRTLNAGFSGSHSLHSLVALLGKGLQTRPKMAVLMENANDLVVLSMTGSYHRAPDSRAVVRSFTAQSAPPTSASFSERCRTLAQLGCSLVAPNLLSRISDGIRSRENTGEVDEWADHRGSQGNFDMTLMAQDFESSIRSFVAISRANSIEPVLMTQFSRFYPDDRFVRDSIYPKDSNVPYDSVIAHYHIFNERIRLVAREEQVFLIDLATMIPPSNHYIYDGVHLNTRGSRLVADSIAVHLAEHFSSFSPVRKQ